MKTAWIGEDVQNGFIIVGKSGPQTVFFCSSPTQGQKMIPNAQSLAYVFPTEEDAHKKITDLMAKYKGIIGWEVEPKGIGR